MELAKICKFQLQVNATRMSRFLDAMMAEKDHRCSADYM